jgi:hypothetical protein
MLNLEEWDHTFEHLAYRQKERWGTPREIEKESFFEADRKTYPDTWDTVDLTNKLVVCVPHSADPVLFGIRGENPATVTEAASLIRAEPIERFAVYRTNQGTDMHLLSLKNLACIQDMHSYRLGGTVSAIPKTIHGGHVIFPISDGEGNEIDCAAFEPTKNFRSLIRELRPGDRVVLSGSVNSGTLNIEKIEIKKLAPLYKEAARLAQPGAAFVLVGFHPFFIMTAGMPTHFQAVDGEPLAIQTHVHLFSDHAKAALEAGWQLLELHEQVIDDRWVETKPSWAPYRDVPISFAWVWRKGEVEGEIRK